MLQRCKPPNFKDYIGFDAEMARILHMENFIPKYLYLDKTYFKNTAKLMRYIETKRKEEIQCEQN